VRCGVGPERDDSSLLSVDKSVLCVGMSLLSGCRSLLRVVRSLLCFDKVWIRPCKSK